MLSPSLDIPGYIKEIFHSLFDCFLDERLGDQSSQTTILVLNKIIQEHGGVSKNKFYHFFGEIFSPEYEVAKSADDLNKFINDVLQKGWDHGCAYTILNKFIDVSQGSWNKDKFAFKFFTALFKGLLKKNICTEVFAKKSDENSYVSASIFLMVGNDILARNAPSITPPIVPSPIEEDIEYEVYKFNESAGRGSLESLDVLHEERDSSNGLHKLPIEEEHVVLGPETEGGEQASPAILPMFGRGAAVPAVLLTPLAKVLLDQVGSNDMDDLLRVDSPANKPRG